MNELHLKSLQVPWVGLVFLCCCQRSLICHTKNQNLDRIHGTTNLDRFLSMSFSRITMTIGQWQGRLIIGEGKFTMNRHSGSSSIFYYPRPREAPSMSNPIFTQSIQGLFSTIKLFRESKWISERWGVISKTEAGGDLCHLLLRRKTVLT